MITSNFDNVILLCGETVNIIGEHHEVYQMRLPTLRDRYEDMNYLVLMGFCGTNLKDLNQQYNMNFTSRYDVYRFYKKNKMTDILKILHISFARYMNNFEYVGDCLYWNKRVIPKQVFNLFCDYFAIAAGVKDIKELQWIITDDMDDFEKRRISMERKIYETKHKDGGGQQVELPMVLATVCYEFHYHMRDLYDMTLFSIYFLYSQTGAIMNYQIGNISAGNGLLDKHAKHSYWSNQKNK